MFNTAQEAQNFAGAFAQALMSANKATGRKAPVGTPSATGWAHGVGGFFGVPGLDEDVLSLRIQPRGISAALPVFPSVYAWPMFAYVTGIEDDGDDEPTTECATCPSATMESCIQSACFGRVCRETKEMTLRRAVERINRGEFDLTMVNDILGGEGDPFAAVRDMGRGQLLQVATLQAMVELGASMQQALVPMVWNGNPANNVGTGLMEYNGLSTLIATGKVDFLTGTTCPALDSDVKDFGYNLVNSIDGNGNFRIVRDLEYMEAYLFHNADRQGLNPVETAVCMRPELWYELSMIWPVAWMSTRNVVWPAGAAAAIGSTSYNIDATRVREMVQEMQQSMTIYINGRRHPVIVDDGILELNNANDPNCAAGEFASDIFFVPLTYMGGRPGTYLQHLDYRAGAADLAAARQTDEQWTDAGRFLWTTERVKFCYTLSAEIRPRIVLRTPQLAGRLNHVRYVPRQHFRSFDMDSDYFFKGGVDHRTQSRVYPDHERSRGVVPTGGYCQPYAQ